MTSRDLQTNSGDLRRLSKDLSKWRKSRQRGQRIPETLWSQAVAIAKLLGVSRTSTALALDYYTLKKRMARSSQPTSKSKAKFASSFVELPAVLGVNECTIELQDASGATMRLQLKGSNIPDVLALSRSFWMTG